MKSSNKPTPEEPEEKYAKFDMSKFKDLPAKPVKDKNHPDLVVRTIKEQSITLPGVPWEVLNEEQE